MAAKHGGNLHELARRAGLDRDRIVDFSASINPLGPPEGLRPLLARNLDRLIHYPDPDCTELATFLAHRFQVAPEQIVAGNGSTEIFFALARALTFTRAVIPVPAYSDYTSAVQKAGRTVDFLMLPASAGFALDWGRLEERLSGGELVLLGQPNNPTGRAFAAETFRAVAARHPQVTFVVDEAFADFMEGYRSLAERIGLNVIVVRSLTKFYAIPGLRIGYAVASAAVAEKIRSQVPPWSVNLLAAEVSAALLSDEEYARRSIALIAEQRRRLAEDLSRLPGLEVFPSAANYLLVRMNRPDLTAFDLAEKLLTQGLAIRTFPPQQNLDEHYFRVAVRTEKENDRLCQALSAMLNRPVGPASSRPAGWKPAPQVGRAKSLMIQGTSSNAGKSLLTAALCRILRQDGIRVAPFKSQNMSLNSFIARDGGEMGRAQVLQAQACGLNPEVRMNPILLKPTSDVGCQVIVRGQPVGSMNVAEYVRYKPQAFAVAKECYDSLAAEFDVVLLEGAGSPAEVNLKAHDIVNMRMAEHADAPVLVAGDIDRGGVFASFVGTMEILAPSERSRVAGWIINRFRGDPDLLESALDYTLRHTGRPVLGVVPYLAALNLPQEDSVEFKSGILEDKPLEMPQRSDIVDIAVIDLPHISNFTDIDAFRIEPDVCLRIVRSATELKRPDAVILPGSKNTLGDLEYLRNSGLADKLATLAHADTVEIVGICGGLQMLGRDICDPLKIESSLGKSPGLGLLDVSTTMAAEKTLVRTTARHAPSGLDVAGYEIHHGKTTPGNGVPLLTRPTARWWAWPLPTSGSGAPTCTESSTATLFAAGSSIVCVCGAACRPWAR